MSHLPTPPIDINPPSRFSSSSPRNQASNLTAGLQKIRATSPSDQPSLANRQHDSLRPSFGRQESNSYFPSSLSASRPIMTGGRSRRDSNPLSNSFMGGMSWGGMSGTSFVHEDIMMGGTSPYQFNSPSFHSSSYLPKMEANFWNNLKCCNETFNDLHDLLSHFEEIHSQAPSNFPYRMSGTPRRKSSTLDAVFSKNNNSRSGGLHSAPMMQDLSNDGLLDTKDILPDMDTFGGDMEMDTAEQTMFQTDLSNYGQQSGQFNGLDNSMMPSALDMTNLGDGGSNPTTPRPPQTGFSQNPMLSSVNTPSFAGSAHQSTQNTPRLAHAGLAIGADPTIGLGPTQYSTTTNTMPFNSQMLQRLNNDFSTFDLGNNNNDMLDLCIAEPAKALYAENGGFNTKAFPQFNFTQNIPINNSDENARKLQAHRLASGIGKVPNEEERPFKCPVIGCEKAYKNANGLRYHEKHGHSTQQLKDNGDGSFSIVDPLTSAPYPGTIGMEKEKPYRCDVCGKRYKNLNGLKYHRNHSPPCNIEGMSMPTAIGEATA